MLTVNRRGGFADRQGIKKQNTEIQLTSLDSRTRIQMFNLVSDLYKKIYIGKYYYDNDVQKFFSFVLSDVFCQAVDTRKRIDDDSFFTEIKEVILRATYDDVLTLIEAIVVYWDQWQYHSYSWEESSCNGIKRFNDLFEKEYVGYRFLNNEISPISDGVEMATINEALDNQYEVVVDHISKAHSFLADREHPDYENSIKESISAVEAICEIITDMRGKEATLGNMLKKLEEKGVVIHGALKSAFNILYGYTSDANGIRHAGDIGGEASTFEEAKFMLVSCCAFINYLKGVMAD